MKKRVLFTSSLALLLVMALPKGMAFAQETPPEPERDRPERLSMPVGKEPSQTPSSTRPSLQV